MMDAEMAEMAEMAGDGGGDDGDDGGVNGVNGGNGGNGGDGGDGGDGPPILSDVDKDKVSKDDKEVKDDGLGSILKDKATALVTAARAFGYGIPTPGPEKPTPTTKIYTNKTYGLSATYSFRLENR